MAQRNQGKGKSKINLDDLTPFARELQQWLWTGRGYGEPPMSRREFARDVVHLPMATVDAWFRPVPKVPGERKPTRPEPLAFWRVVAATGWNPEQLAALSGYPEVPPRELDPWDFLLEEAPKRFDYDAARLAETLQWLNEMRKVYEKKPKRPAQQHERQSTSVSQDRRRKETVATGK